MPERRFSVQIELKLYDFAVPEGYGGVSPSNIYNVCVFYCICGGARDTNDQGWFDHSRLTRDGKWT